MKKSNLLLLLLAAVYYPAVAEEPKVLSMSVKELTYVADVRPAKDGGITLETKVEWEGVRVVQSGNTCQIESQKISSIKTHEKLGAAFQVPVVEKSSMSTPCPG